MNVPRELLTVPNLLTCFRFACAPVLLLLAWQGHATAFLLLLAAAFLSDALDGAIARLTGQATPFGAVLDSWADMFTYLVVAVGAWWLWPETVRREALYAGMIIASYLLPAAVGLLKFGAFTSYHTWTVKLAAAAVGLSFYALFLGGVSWPFRVAAAISAAAAIEEIAITLVSRELHSNVRSLWDVMRRFSRRI
jgi:CDP-diacylglycerol--glycerol-3-phosphate 3-phosphatidyltransferase